DVTDEGVIADDQRRGERGSRGDVILGASRMRVDARVGRRECGREGRTRIATLAADAALQIITNRLCGDGRCGAFRDAAEAVRDGEQHDARRADLGDVCFIAAVLRDTGSRADRYFHVPTPRTTR